MCINTAFLTNQESDQTPELRAAIPFFLCLHGKTCGCSLVRREGKNFRRAIHTLHAADSSPPLSKV